MAMFHRFGVLGFIALAGLGAGGAWYYFAGGSAPYREASSRLDSVLAESRKLGLPFTYAELSPAIPDNENAALIVLPLANKIAGMRIVRSVLEDGPSDPDYKLASSKFRDAFPDLEKVAAAVELPGWRAPREDITVLTQLPELSQLKELAHLMAFRARAAAQAGDVETCLRMVTAGKKLAQHITEDPVLISQLVGIACDAIVHGSAETIADQWHNQPALLKRLEETMAATSLRIDPRNAIRSEFYAVRDLAVNLETYGGLNAFATDATGPATPPDMSKRRTTGLPEGARERAYFAVVAEHYNRAMREIGPEPGIKAGWADRTDRAVADSLQTVEPSEAMLKVFSIQYAMVDRARIKQIAYSRMIQVLCQALRDPKQTPALPEDPFAPRQKLKFRRSGEIIKVWTVGPNGKDDGGRHSMSSGDLVFSYPAHLVQRPAK